MELRVVESGILIEAIGGPSAGWAKAAADLEARDDGGLLDDVLPTSFDEAEWEW